MSGLRVYISFYILHGRQQEFTLLRLHFCVAQFYNHFIHRPPTFCLIDQSTLGNIFIKAMSPTSINRYQQVSTEHLQIEETLITCPPELLIRFGYGAYLAWHQGTGILISILPCPTPWRCSSVEVISFSLVVQVSPPTRASIQECPSSPRAKQHNVNNRQMRH